MQKGQTPFSLHETGQALIFLLIGILVIAVAGGAFYLGRQTTNKPSSAPGSTSQTLQSVSTTSPTEVSNYTYNPPAGWKKFNSSLLKLSFYYPSEFKVIESGEGLSEVNLTKGISLSEANSPASWGIGEFSDYAGESRREWYLKKHPEISTDDKSNLKFTEFTTVNTSGLLVTYTGNNSGWRDALLIARGGNIFVVSANSGNEMNQQFFKSIMMDGNNSPQAKQPLTETAQTTDWKTYTNRNGQYFLKYPSDWQVKSENKVLDSVTTKTTLQSNDLATKAINTPGIGGEQLTKGSKLEISVSNNNNFKSYEQLKDFMDNKFTGFPLNYFTSSEEMTINGVKATLKRGGKTNELALGNTFCYFFKNGITYEFSFTNSENDDTLFNQILTTFKFL